MNLLCPSCQNPLTVPEQYAGQTMKCPLCGNNFTVPSLPAAAATPPAGPSPALAPEPETHDFTPIDLSGPMVTPPPPPRPAPDHEDGEPRIYGVTSEPVPDPAAPAPPPAPRPAPAQRPAPKPAPPPPPPPRTTPVGYARTRSATLDARVIYWAAPALLVIVFVLSFFPWVGLYYGSSGVVTQSAWGAAFGGYSVDEIFDHMTNWEKKTPPEDKPGASALMILFVLVGLLPAVLLGVAAAAFPQIRSRFRLPPEVARLEQWRWLIVAGWTVLALLFLFLQVLTSFNFEARTRERIAKEYEAKRASSNSIEQRWIDMQEAHELEASGLRRTWELRWSFWLLVLAALAAAAAHWLEHRDPGRPPPRFEVAW